MKKLPDRDEILNLWLFKYHNTTVKEVVDKHPKEVLESPDWFKLYPCTKEQYEEWKNEVKDLLRKKYKMSKRFIERGWWSIELDCSPYIKDNNFEV